MRRRDLLAGLAAGGAVGPAWAGAQRDERTQAAALGAALAETWPLRYADLEAHPEYALAAWVSLLRERDARAALASGHGGALARAHAELAASYRLAAIATAHALLSVFDTRRAPTDPAGSLHLVAVSRAILGDRAAARAAAAQVTSDPAIDPWHAPWRAWLATDTPFPPPLVLPVPLAPPTVGGSPEVGPLPHYTLPLAPPADDLARPFGDPGLLVALASWHEAAARAVPGVEAAQLDGWFALHAWPGAPAAAVPALTDPFVYGGPVLAAVDGPFLGALATDGPGAVERWAERSPLAWLARSAQVDGVVDAAAAEAVARRAHTWSRRRRTRWAGGRATTPCSPTSRRGRCCAACPGWRRRRGAPRWRGRCCWRRWKVGGSA
jgi:hypothetical protein